VVVSVVQQIVNIILVTKDNISLYRGNNKTTNGPKLDKLEKDITLLSNC